MCLRVIRSTVDQLGIRWPPSPLAMAKNALLNLYLLAFNALSGAGWAYVLFLTVSTVLAQREAGEQDWSRVSRAVWDTVALPLQAVQTLAVMEIVHAAVGFVRSPLGSTLMQGTYLYYCQLLKSRVDALELWC